MVTCRCDSADEWCIALEETGYPFCPRCREHHRHPETCPGITPDGEGGEYRWSESDGLPDAPEAAGHGSLPVLGQ